MIDTMPERSGFREIVETLLGFIVHPVQTHRWLRYLRTHPALTELAVFFPCLKQKIHHPYLCQHSTCGERVAMLIGHYEVLSRAGFIDLLRRTATHPVVICKFSGKTGTPYQLELSAVAVPAPEGELMLRLVSKDVCIYTITFILIVLAGEVCIKVGGLHGFLATDDALRIKRITHDMHGCRPKDLMIAITQEVGCHFGCGKALFISNRNRIPMKNHRICKKSSNYDLTWVEFGASLRSDGDFETPCTRALPGQANGTDMLPRKKRAEAKKRAAWLTSILDTVQEHLAADGASTPHATTRFPAILTSTSGPGKAQIDHTPLAG